MKTKISIIILMTIAVITVCGYLLRVLYTDNDGIEMSLVENLIISPNEKTDIIPLPEMASFNEARTRRSSSDDAAMNGFSMQENLLLESTINAPEAGSSSKANLRFNIDMSARSRTGVKATSGSSSSSPLYAMAGVRSSGNQSSSGSGSMMAANTGGNNMIAVPGPLFNNGSGSDDDDVAPFDDSPPPEGAPVGSGLVFMLLLAALYMTATRYKKI